MFESEYTEEINLLFNCQNDAFQVRVNANWSQLRNYNAMIVSRLKLPEIQVGSRTQYNVCQ